MVKALDLSMLRSDLRFEIDSSPFCASSLMMVPLSLDAKHNLVVVVRRRNVSALISSLSNVFTLWSPSNHTSAVQNISLHMMKALHVIESQYLTL